MHATGTVAIASIQAASTANSIHRGRSSVKRASPTHGGRWLAQTNYDALMTHHTTENCLTRQMFVLCFVLLWLIFFYFFFVANHCPLFVELWDIFTQILQGYFPGIGAIMSQCQGSNPEGYGWKLLVSNYNTTQQGRNLAHNVSEYELQWFEPTLRHGIEFLFKFRGSWFKLVTHNAYNCGVFRGPRSLLGAVSI